MPSFSPRQVVRRFREVLVSHGLREAMRYVNAQSAHRFTAIYHFDGPVLRNLLLVDKEDTEVQSCPDLPVLESYCLYVQKAVARFQVESAASDARVKGHPKQLVVQSYCGIPILAGDGTLWGTICHFDFQPRAFEGDEVEVLETVAPMIMRAIEDGAAEELQARREATA